MELAYSKEDEAFRKEVRVWLKKNLPKKDKAVSDLMPHDPERVRRAKEWQRKLYKAGYLGAGWPPEYGGAQLTPMQQAEYSPELLRATDAKIPIGRHARPEEIAALFAFLASDEGAYITGAAIPIDGGELAGGLASHDWIRVEPEATDTR